MKTEHRKIDTLLPYARNSRTHSDDQVAQIAASIKEFGFNNPVLIAPDGEIIAGHGRVQAARKLGLEEVPCVTLDHLTDNQRRAYVIADNKLALNAGWDEEMLSLELAALREINFDIDLTGFDADAIETLLNPQELNFDPGTEADQGRLDQLSPKMVTCPNCKKTFDSRGYEQN